MQIASVIPHGIISVFASAAGNRALGAAFFRAIAAFVVTERVDSGWGHEHTRSLSDLLTPTKVSGGQNGRGATCACREVDA